MKKLLTLVLLVGFLMVGCQDDNSILEPTNDVASSLNKGRIILADNLDYSLNDVTIKSHYSKNFTIDGKKGGKLSIRHQWKDVDGTNVWLEAELWIPRNAFKGTLTFDMIFDLENLSMELYPSPFAFDKPVEFSMGFYGVDLSAYTGYEFDFNYLDGEQEPIKYFRKNVDIANGELEVWDAQLHHFSRYGWSRKK